MPRIQKNPFNSRLFDFESDLFSNKSHPSRMFPSPMPRVTGVEAYNVRRRGVAAAEALERIVVDEMVLDFFQESTRF